MTGLLTYILGNAPPGAKAARLNALGGEEWSMLVRRKMVVVQAA